MIDNPIGMIGLSINGKRQKYMVHMGCYASLLILFHRFTDNKFIKINLRNLSRCNIFSYFLQTHV
jgi:hypothetical protein